MEKRAALLTTGHPWSDERIFWKFARTLQSDGFQTAIFASTSEVDLTKENILVKGFDGKALSKKDKVNKFIPLLSSFTPTYIICAEPLALIAAHRYQKKNRDCFVFSDITEWYPESYLLKLSLLKRIILYPVYMFFNIYATNLADGLIIGESFKKKRYNIIAPFKKKAIIGYYPVMEFFPYTTPPFAESFKQDGATFTLGYAGLINFKRGIVEMYNLASRLAEKYTNLNIKLKLSGRFEYPHEEVEFMKLIQDKGRLQIELSPGLPYNEYSRILDDVDVGLDFRIKNFIYRNSLPIKIFEYMSCGKPFIFTDIEPIRKEIGTKKFGVLVNPEKPENLMDAAEKYINNPDLLKVHSYNCRKAIENGKNWETEAKKLIRFLTSFQQ